MNKVIFWDFDGTLVHPNESFLLSLQSACAQYGVPVEENQIRAFLQNACSWHTPEETYIQRTHEGWWLTLFEKTKQFCLQNKIDAAIVPKICTAFRDNELRYPYMVYDDTPEVLSFYLQQGYRNYLLTNNYPEIVDTMKRLGLDRYFTDYIVSSHVGYEKPRAELFRHALAKAGQPDICYMVGDNPIADIQGAHNAGIPAILVHTQTEIPHPGVFRKELTDIKTIITDPTSYR